VPKSPAAVLAPAQLKGEKATATWGVVTPPDSTETGCRRRTSSPQRKGKIEAHGGEKGTVRRIWEADRSRTSPEKVTGVSSGGIRKGACLGNTFPRWTCFERNGVVEVEQIALNGREETAWVATTLPTFGQGGTVRGPRPLSLAKQQQQREMGDLFRSRQSLRNSPGKRTKRGGKKARSLPGAREAGRCLFYVNTQTNGFFRNPRKGKVKLGKKIGTYANGGEIGCFLRTGKRLSPTQRGRRCLLRNFRSQRLGRGKKKRFAEATQGASHRVEDKGASCPTSKGKGERTAACEGKAITMATVVRETEGAPRNPTDLKGGGGGGGGQKKCAVFLSLRRGRIGSREERGAPRRFVTLSPGGRKLSSTNVGKKSNPSVADPLKKTGENNDREQKKEKLQSLLVFEGCRVDGR